MQDRVDLFHESFKFEKYFKKNNHVYLLALIMSVCLLIVVVPLLYLIIENRGSSKFLSETIQTEICRKSLLRSIELSLLVLFVLSIMTLVALFRAKDLKENLGIREEILKCSIAIMITSVVMSSDLWSNMEISKQMDRLMRWDGGFEILEVLLPTVSMVWFSLIQVLRDTSKFHRGLPEKLSGKDLAILSERKARSDEESIVVIRLKFLKLLNSPEGSQLFQEFLKTELSVENILFWKDVQKFKNSEIEAEAIFEMYIPHSAPLCINISSREEKSGDLV